MTCKGVMIVMVASTGGWGGVGGVERGRHGGLACA